jgi:hypothetical protein
VIAQLIVAENESVVQIRFVIDQRIVAENESLLRSLRSLVRSLVRSLPPVQIRFVIVQLFVAEKLKKDNGNAYSVFESNLDKQIKASKQRVGIQKTEPTKKSPIKLKNPWLKWAFEKPKKITNY